MIPKLDNCYNSLNKGVQHIKIGHHSMLQNNTICTQNTIVKLKTRMLGRKKMRLNENIEILTKEAISLLKALIETPSFSSEEDKTAVLIENWFAK
jgi:hypothetical protein